MQLKRRYDLIPNLVETAKGYMQHERETLEAVIKARNQAVSAAQARRGRTRATRRRCSGLCQAEGALAGALGRLIALAEAYPDLKANQNMLALQEELTSTENKVAFARQAFNDSVMEYNTKRESFPDNIFAGMFRFDPAELLQRHRIGRGAQGAEGFVHVAWISSSSRSARAAARAGSSSGTLLAVLSVVASYCLAVRLVDAFLALSGGCRCAATRRSMAAVPDLLAALIRVPLHVHASAGMVGAFILARIGVPHVAAHRRRPGDRRTAGRALRRAGHAARRPSAGCSTWSRRWRSPRASRCRRSTCSTATTPSTRWSPATRRTRR